MKLKNLKKKIRRLEKRLQDGPKKLIKLRRKLDAMVAAAAMEARRKSAAHTRAVRKVATSSTRARKKPGAARKAKRKLNLSPERRAQLAAAMKTRWAAKRAETNPQNTSTDQDRGALG